MALKLVGKKTYDYTNEKGVRYTGVKLHCLQQYDTPLEGFLTEVISVGSAKPIYPTANDFPFGTIFTPVYDKYGRIADLILVALPGDEGNKEKK